MENNNIIQIVKAQRVIVKKEFRDKEKQFQKQSREQMENKNQ